MKKYLILGFLGLPGLLFGQRFSPTELQRCQRQAQRVEIVRDSWGIPHIYGQSDADAVFGLLYAQCEDDFRRVEMNYIEKLGRLAEVNGPKDIYNDLQIRLLIDSTEAIADYRKAAPWLKKLLNAYADGINFYLHTHPQVKPALLTRFQPWYPLLWTDGSIGAISTADISNDEIRKFYSQPPSLSYSPTPENKPRDPDIQTGSNGFAIGPSLTASGKAILYINPHVTFYFRPEVQVVSGEGLQVYGAVTWGQFFVYQGFNEHCGWMHTSSNVDVSDMYAEKITQQGQRFFYEYEGKLRPVREKSVILKFKENHEIKSRTFTTYYTHHGPVMARREGRWISLRSHNRSMTSLIQSWKRTKARGFEEFKSVMDLRSNTSNNTVFADKSGNIAYLHGNFVPTRNPQFNWGKVVDGSTAATEWGPLHPVDETVHSYNPPNGWIQNCNSTPYTVAGKDSPKPENFKKYMAPDGENFRGINAVRVLSQNKDYTLDKVIAAGYDTYLSAFELLVPAIVRAYEHGRLSDSLRTLLAEPVEVLKSWDFRAHTSSVATTLAIETAQKYGPQIAKVYIEEGEIDQVESTRRFAQSATAEALLLPLAQTVKDLSIKFGTWQKPWGDINRFQRLAGGLQETYDDQQPSLPVAYASALWGCLPSYNSRYFSNTRNRYGFGGNSFVCAVEFGERVRAKSVLAGGQSSDISSPHFKDQAEMYTQGRFKEVLLYKEDVLKNAQKTYHPGQ
jgi:acyl-homoserine-lactone acylase